VLLEIGALVTLGDMDPCATLATELRAAVPAGGLSIEFQPLFDLDESGRPARPVAVEALCRWPHPRFGTISPVHFIPLAESHGIIADLGAAVLTRAGTQVAAWQRDGHDLGLSVNASPSEFSAAWVDTVAQRAADLGLAPGSLTIEITESPAPQLMPSVLAVLERARAAGLGLSIDDLGAGDTTTPMLDALPLTEVKIDRSLTQRSDAVADEAVAAVVEQARRNGWSVVAEGIETVDDLERARRRGCVRGQGFLLGRPMPAAELSALLG
jgi:EAL domain-containing protein (putative c-di-GMP-specific phosphodiesterase class I)